MAEKENTGKVVIDAANGIMGRIASYAAKQALLGKNVEIVNCNDTMISGKPHAVVASYAAKIARGGTAQKGPYIGRTPEGIFKRAVRGMLPWSKTRGREAFKRVKCYADVPASLESEKKLSFKEDFNKPYITMKEMLKLI